MPATRRARRPAAGAAEEEEQQQQQPREMATPTMAPGTTNSDQEAREPAARRRAAALPALPRALAARGNATAATKKKRAAESAAENEDSDVQDSDADSDEDSDEEADPFAGVELARKAPASLGVSKRIEEDDDKSENESENEDEDDREGKGAGVPRGPDGKPLFPTRLQPQKSASASVIERETQRLLSNDEALCAPSATALQQRDLHARKRGEKKDWHDMVTPELTPEVKMDLRALQLRNYMDPSRFYKANDSSTLPQKFQIGTIKEGLGEFKSHRVKKRDRKPTFVDEVLADSSVSAYTKRVFGGLQAERARDPFSTSKRRKTGSGRGRGRGRGRR